MISPISIFGDQVRDIKRDICITSSIIQYTNIIVRLCIYFIHKHSQYWYEMAGAAEPVQPDLDHLGDQTHKKASNSVDNVYSSISKRRLVNK